MLYSNNIYNLTVATLGLLNLVQKLSNLSLKTSTTALWKIKSNTNGKFKDLD